VKEGLAKYQSYPKYMPSGVGWIGDIPEGWEVRRLRFLAKNLDGKRIPLNSQERSEKQGVYPYWGANGILDYINEYIFDEEIVLIGEDGAPFFEPLKEKAFYVNQKVWVNNHAHVLSCQGISSMFFKDVLNSVDYGEYIKGATRDKLNQADLKNIDIPLPTFPEQQSIISFLDRETTRINAIIEKQNRLIELLKEKRSALITQAVTKGLDLNVKMKLSGIEWIGVVPEMWCINRIKFLLSGGLTNGLFKKSAFYGSGTKLVNVFDIYTNNFVIDYEKLERVEANTEEKDAYCAREGDIFFVRSSLKEDGIAVSACMLKPIEDAVFECHLIRARPKTSVVLPKFLAYQFNSILVRKRLVALSETVTMTTIAQPKLNLLEVLVPPLTEQQDIVAFLDGETAKIDTLVSKIQKQIDLLNEYKQSLITAAVTGKIDVRDSIYATNP